MGQREVLTVHAFFRPVMGVTFTYFSSSALEIRSKFGILGFVDEREPENPQNMNKQTNKVKERA